MKGNSTKNGEESGLKKDNLLPNNGFTDKKGKDEKVGRKRKRRKNREARELNQRERKGRQNKTPATS